MNQVRKGTFIFLTSFALVLALAEGANHKNEIPQDIRDYRTLAQARQIAAKLKIDENHLNSDGCYFKTETENKEYLVRLTCNNAKSKNLFFDLPNFVETANLATSLDFKANGLLDLEYIRAQSNAAKAVLAQFKILTEDRSITHSPDLNPQMRKAIVDLFSRQHVWLLPGGLTPDQQATTIQAFKNFARASIHIPPHLPIRGIYIIPTEDLVVHDWDYDNPLLTVPATMTVAELNSLLITLNNLYQEQRAVIKEKEKWETSLKKALVTPAGPIPVTCQSSLSVEQCMIGLQSIASALKQIHFQPKQTNIQICNNSEGYLSPKRLCLNYDTPQSKMISLLTD